MSRSTHSASETASAPTAGAPPATGSGGAGARDDASHPHGESGAGGAGGAAGELRMEEGERFATLDPYEAKRRAKLWEQASSKSWRAAVAAQTLLIIDKCGRGGGRGPLARVYGGDDAGIARVAKAMQRAEKSGQLVSLARDAGEAGGGVTEESEETKAADEAAGADSLFDTELLMWEGDSFDAARWLVERQRERRRAAGSDGAGEEATLTSHDAGEDGGRTGRAHPPAVLDFASDKNPGGGWKGGASAQEESLCRRSTLGATLELMRNAFPLAPGEGIYCRSVVFRDKETRGCGMLREPFSVGVVAVPAVRHPRTIDEDTMAADDAAVMESKVRLILQTALDNGHVDIVLGAFGCGVFACPPKHVARIFRSALFKPSSEFYRRFRTVVFAIMSLGRWTRNMARFQAVFERQLKEQGSPPPRTAPDSWNSDATEPVTMRVPGDFMAKRAKRVREQLAAQEATAAAGAGRAGKGSRGKRSGRKGRKGR